MVTCCHKCERRHMGCHATCETYIEAKKAHDERNAGIQAQKKFMREQDAMAYGNYRRNARSKARSAR